MSMKVTRRGALAGMAATGVAAVTLPATAGLLKIHDDPFVTWLAEWDTLKEQSARVSEAWRKAQALMPEWAQHAEPPLHDLPGLGFRFATVETIQECFASVLTDCRDASFRRRLEQRRDKEIARRREFKERMDAEERKVGLDKAEARGSAICDQISELEDRILDTPADTIFGVIAKLRVVWCYEADGCKDDDGPFYLNAFAPKGALDAAERAAGLEPSPYIPRVPNMEAGWMAERKGRVDADATA